MPTYKILSQKHPEWDGHYWRRCRALYSGGQKLLKDMEVMRDVFPPHLHELPHVYAERIKRAYYIPYAGEVIDMITSALFSEDLKVSSEDNKADAWYDEWAKDVSPPGGSKQTLPQFLKEQITTALLCKRSWTLIDLPTIDDLVREALKRQTTLNGITGAPPGSLAEQEKLGLLNAYACPIDPEAVWDWQMDRDGRLLWVIIHYRFQERDSLMGTRDMVTERWMYYTETSWERYEITYKKTAPPTDGMEIPKIGEGPHSFGQVPVLRLELPDGLWAMGKIESIAVAHLNKRNALSWAQYKSLFPVMAHFAGPPDVTNPITDDPDRALNQTVGQGHIFQLGDKDRFEFVGPDTSAYAIALQDLNNLRDEMHRVVHQMAMSVDNSAAALQRSGESKQVDQSSTAIVLREFGKIAREHVIEVFEVVQMGRQDPTPVVWLAEGMDGYNDTSADQLVTQAQGMELVTIPSATFQREYKLQVARKVLGDSVEEETIDDIRKELEQNITNEMFQAPTPMDMAAQEQADKETSQGFAEKVHETDTELAHRELDIKEKAVGAKGQSKAPAGQEKNAKAKKRKPATN